MTFEKEAVNEEFTLQSEFDELGWIREGRMAKCPDSIKTETVTIASKGGHLMVKAPESVDTIALEAVAKQVYVGAAADRSVADGRGSYIMRHGQEMLADGDVEDGEKMVFRNTALEPERYLAESGDLIMVTLYAEDKVHVNFCGSKVKRIGFTGSAYGSSLDIVTGSKSSSCRYIVDCVGNDMVIKDAVLVAALRNQAILAKAGGGKYIGLIDFVRIDGSRFVDSNKYFGQNSAAINREFIAAEEKRGGLPPAREEYDILVRDETEMEIIDGAVDNLHVQEKRFIVTAVSDESDGRENAARIEASLIDFGKTDMDPWPLIDGSGDPASELCELLYSKYEKVGELGRICEPFLFVEKAEGEATALQFLFLNLSFVAQKMYGVRATAIGMNTRAARFSVPEVFAKEFENTEYGYVMYRLDGEITYRKPGE